MPKKTIPNPNRAPTLLLIGRVGLLQQLVLGLREIKKGEFDKEPTKAQVAELGQKTSDLLMEAAVLPDFTVPALDALPEPPQPTPAEGDRPEQPPSRNSRYRHFDATLIVFEGNLGKVKGALEKYEATLVDTEVVEVAEEPKAAPPPGVDAPEPGKNGPPPPSPVEPPPPAAEPEAPKAPPPPRAEEKGPSAPPPVPPPAEEPRAKSPPPPRPPPAPEPDPREEARRRWGPEAREEAPPPREERRSPPPRTPPPREEAKPEADGNSLVPWVLGLLAAVALLGGVIWAFSDQTPTVAPEATATAPKPEPTLVEPTAPAPKAPATVSKGEQLDCSGATANVALDGVTYTVIPVHNGDTTVFVEGWTVKNGTCLDGDSQGGTSTVTTNDFAELRKGLQAKLGGDPSGMSQAVKVNGRTVRCNQGFEAGACFK